MPIQLEDGGFLDASDWSQIMRLLAEKGQRDGARTANDPPPPKVTEIRSRDGVTMDGVTIKVGNLELKKKPKMPLSNPDAIEGSYKGFTIRVWRQKREEIYGCNYWRPGSEDIRYFEYRFIDVRDENHMFQVAKQCIDQVIAAGQ